MSSPLLGRIRRPAVCFYGCCHAWHVVPKRKHRVVRINKRREKRAWQKEYHHG